MARSSAPEDKISLRLVKAKDQVGASRLQMLRWQVVAGLESFIANRTDKLRDAVLSSS